MTTVETRGPLQQPVQRDLRHALAGFLRHGVQRIHDLVEIFVFHLRPDIGGLDAGGCPWAAAAPRRILPVSRPQPSGDHTTQPTPWSSASGISSHS